MHRLIHYTTIIVLVLLLLVTTSVARPRGNSELFTVEKNKINTKRKPARSPLSTNKLQRQLAEMKKKIVNGQTRNIDLHFSPILMNLRIFKYQIVVVLLQWFKYS